MEAILEHEHREEDDFYKILNCSEHSTIEQINTEYKILALEYHPDKNPGDHAADEKFARLQRAKEVLCDQETRKRYDQWKNSGIAMSYDRWCGLRDSVQTFAWLDLDLMDLGPLIDGRRGNFLKAIHLCWNAQILSQFDLKHPLVKRTHCVNDRSLPPGTGVVESFMGNKSMHWASIKPQPMLDHPDHKIKPRNQQPVRATTTSNPLGNAVTREASSAPWERDAASVTLSKFRNYEI